MKLKRETVTYLERFDVNFVKEACVLVPTTTFYLTIGMFLLLALLGAIAATNLVIVFFVLGCSLLPGYDVDLTSSWGDGEAAWAALATIATVSVLQLTVAVTGFIGLWRRWKLAMWIRVHRGSL